MLVLSRKIGEKIVVPSCGLTITVVGARGSRVRLGITAPPNLRVDREEVWQRFVEASSGAVAKPAASIGNRERPTWARPLVLQEQ